MTEHTNREETLSQLRWITSNQLEEGDYAQIMALFDQQLAKERETSFRAGYKAAGGDVSIVDGLAQLSAQKKGDSDGR